jgi:hypothetical protein
MELVISTAVTQKASQARCMVDMPSLGFCSRIASSTASTKALTKGAGFPMTIAISMNSRVSGTTIETLSMVCT